MRKGDEDWVQKCMEFRVEGRRPVGRPRTWLESVEADMAELEIDKEDVHDRKKWRENVMRRKPNPIGKWTINRIYIMINRNYSMRGALFEIHPHSCMAHAHFDVGAIYLRTIQYFRHQNMSIFINANEPEKGISFVYMRYDI